MENKQYGVIGLGIFGSTVATTLANRGYDVIVMDHDHHCVEHIVDEVTKGVIGDGSDIDELKAANFDECDVVVVAIGTQLEEAVLTIMNLKELGVPYIIAKAMNKQYAKILEKIGADRIVQVEKDMGIKVAKSLYRQNIKDIVELDDDYSLVEIKVLKKWLDKTILELNLRQVYGINVIGIKTSRDGKFSMDVNLDYRLQKDDYLLVIGNKKDLNRFE